MGTPGACRARHLVQRHRNKPAVLKLLRNLLKKQGVRPEAIVTDKLRSYGAALRSFGMHDGT